MLSLNTVVQRRKNAHQCDMQFINLAVSFRLLELTLNTILYLPSTEKS